MKKDRSLKFEGQSYDIYFDKHKDGVQIILDNKHIQLDKNQINILMTFLWSLTYEQK